MALDSNGDKEKFWKLLDERLNLQRDALLFRIENVKQALPKYNPAGFMYGGYGRLDPDGNVDELFNHNRASVSMGYVGLYEMTARFYGDWQHDHTYNQEAHDFAIPSLNT
ncbi:anaerobic ribonucleoside-triphosphate reductase [Lactiplantibacillus plantarum]|uniref:anaerobic ribonucleoside-triphosphate reductase n=1 Tax=Lactiplantibacillus plantarum TaxID=1590 RepID=UPI0023082763|nr:anaerobic ribonucleoside-triphosphate reductase [Lactiplantibacillus plantarum]WCE45111.1 anaerobic ribonucleoside-triphosphate reductase [Lactiplantibacillus plantarum]